MTRLLPSQKLVDVVLDLVCGQPMLSALKATNWGARIMTIGTGAGRQVNLDIADLLFRSLYQALARWGATPTQDDLELAERARDRLTELAQERPALIRQAASLQALVSRGIEGCDDCLPGLMAMAWAQAGSPTAPPTRGESSPGMGDDLTRDFLERLAEDAK